MNYWLLRLGGLLAFFTVTNLWALASTTGTPLGGFGTGYIKYNARNGDFAAVVKVMPAASLAASEFGNYRSSSCGFHFSVNGTGKQKATTTSEDAKMPVYYADFGATGGVTFKLTAFGPWIPGSNALYDQLAHSPLACFDIAATNSGASAVNNVAVALEFSNQTSGSTNLLGGANTGAADGTSAITWAGTENGYMLVSCDIAGATTSAGALGSFLTTGNCTAGAGNVVSAKCNIPAGATAHFQFIISWWTQWRNSSKGNEDHWYHNYYANAKEAAVLGMSNFDQMRTGATSIVDRTVATNFPEWFEDRLLNNLYPMAHNSVVAKDGRTGFWEGRYPIIGTIDQGEHASIWYCFNWPQNQWRELQYWARQQRQEANLLGQIHHDFNGTTSGSWSYSNTDANHFLYPWDNYTHQDYWYQPNTTDWGDLQAMFIFKAYELMLADANKDSLTKYWPAIKRASDRMITQCGSRHLADDNVRSTYDDGSSTPVYCAGVQLAAWLAMVEMAKWLGDNATASKVQNWYNQGRAEFAGRFYNSNFCSGQAKSEGDIAGYSWARYFGFPAIFDSNIVTTGCNRLWSYYSIQSGRARLGQWHFYAYDHWGGAAIAIGKQDTAMLVHKWDYDYYYTGNPAYVHWQDLNSTNNTYASYMTAPCVWRSMFQICGYLLDNAFHRLWIRPMIPKSMNNKITNAPLINPKAWGTLNYDETFDAASQRYQNISVTFDSPTQVDTLMLKNNTGLSAFPANTIVISNGGANVSGFTATAVGSGYEKNIKIAFASPIQIGPQGATIQVFGQPTGISGNIVPGSRPELKLPDGHIRAGTPFTFSVAVPGYVTLELISLSGVKIATVFQGSVSTGSHTAIWNGLSGNRGVGSGIAVARLVSPAGVISKVVKIER
ncbi:MAG: hypothetical protein JW768_09795 [Chitinispirillaceae bacterium]|nr:hypothetical protein [Chitinispirillaceae bacterium]